MEFTQKSGEFVISADRARLDLEVIHGFLTNCYWAKGIQRDVIARSIEHSLCFGIYHEEDVKSPLLAKSARGGAPRAPQVGFARVITDFATVEQVDDGVHHAASFPARAASMDLADARCARALREVWIHTVEGAGSLHGVAPG